MINRFRATAVIVALAGGAITSANAEVIATVSYHDLAGNYVQSSNPSVGSFSAVAVNTANLQSSYEASRLVPVSETASFEAGFVSNPFNPADFQITLSVNKVNSTLATGAGSFTATDRDGDTITGNLSGAWTFGGGGFIFFNGNLSNVVYTDNGAADNTFDGTEGGDFGMNFNAVPPFAGSVVQLVFGGPGSTGFFTQSFSDRATGGSMQIVPSPGSIALLGLGGLAFASRRRSR
jgi:hypothetical protein